MAQAKVRRIVLAYSGGLDTSVILRWLVDRYQAEVVAFCADLGQAEELAGLEDKAARTGAAWAAYRALNGGVCAAATLNLTEGATAGFRLDVQCTQSSHTEGTGTVRVFVFVSGLVSVVVLVNRLRARARFSCACSYSCPSSSPSSSS